MHTLLLLTAIFATSAFDRPVATCTTGQCPGYVQAPVVYQQPVAVTYTPTTYMVAPQQTMRAQPAAAAPAYSYGWTGRRRMTYTYTAAGSCPGGTCYRR